MSDTWSGSLSTDWFNASNWSGGAPVISATGTQSVVINGSLANQPVISPFASDATHIISTAQTLITNGTTYTVLENSQIGGEIITLTNHADLTVAGLAMGVFYGTTGDTLTPNGATMTGLHGALTTTPTADMHMQLSIIGTDTLSVETINEFFGFITIGTGDTLAIENNIGGNQQALHGFINYGEISIGSGGLLEIDAQSSIGTTVANFYNAGWIVDNGGTLSISSNVLDGASTIATGSSVDGFIEIYNSGDVVLNNSVSTHEQIDFADTTASTLQITAGTLFSGTVNNFGPNDTIIVNGFTSTSNATITTVGGVTELVTANGTVITTITLTGVTSTDITTGTNSSGQEYIVSGGTNASSNTTYSGGNNTLGSAGGTATNNGTIAVINNGTLTIDSSLSGTGLIYIDYGATAALDNTTGNDAGQTVQFGTHGSASGFNTLIINDNTAGFGGTVTGFGAYDEIVLGSKVATEPTTGSGALLSYNSTSHVLTVEDTNSSTGSIISSTQISIAGTAALSTASFVEIYSSAGPVIELASNVAGTGYNFSIASGTTGGFETPANFTGGTAPGDSLVASETATIASGTASVASAGITDNGTITVLSGAGFLDNGSLTGTGTLSVAAGGNATLGGNVSLGAILDSGTINITGTAPVGPIDMEGNGAGSIAEFSTTSPIPTLYSFGTSDELIAKGVAIPPGDGLVLSYNSVTGVLTGAETNSSGATLASASVTITGVSGTTLSTGSFIALQSSAGEIIELAPTAATSFTFSTTGTGVFETAANFTGGVAPGDILSANETVSIAAGTASVSSGGVADAGKITIVSGATFLDNSSLTGTGTLNIAAGGSATLGGYTSLTAPITDAGSVTLNGSVASAVTLSATASQAYVTGTLVDSGTLAGSGTQGTLTVEKAAVATFNGGVSVASVLDYGTIVLGGSSTSINMEGNSAGSVVDFTGTSTAAPLTNLGTTDKIIIGTSALTAPVPGTSGVILSYNTASGVLTVEDTASSGGSIISTANITVSGTAAGALSTTSFVALASTNGEIIELASNLTGAGFNFSTTGTGAFEAPANFTGGVAPGDTLVAGETVTIAAGTASVSSTGVADAGTIVVDSGAGFLSGTIKGAGTLAILTGGNATIAGGSSLGSILDSGTIALTGATGVSSINMEGNGANSVVDFTGTSTATPLTNLGTSDEIILGTGVLTAPVPGTSGISLSYAAGVLTVKDTSLSNGATIGTVDSITVSGTAGGTLSTSSFVALASTKGEIIELASSLPTQSFVFATTGSFETPANFTGGIAPGDTLVAGETVTIASGTATVSGTGVTDNGLITVSSGAGFLDAHSLSGTGSLAVGAGASATLTGATTLGSINDAGTLILGGADAVAISLASGAQASIASSFTDTSAITGAGTLTLDAGITATLATGSSVGLAADFGTLDLSGSFGGPINLEGNGKNTVADFTGTNVSNHTLQTSITNLGYTDKIILGAADFALGTTNTLTETYNSTSGLLTINDNNGSNVTIAVSLASGDLPANIRVTTSAAGLVVTLCFYPGTALATPNGEVMVENLKPGDMLITANGAKPVRWIGQSHIHTGFADPLRSLPIRIRQGALGEGLPMRDLLLSPDHAVHIDNILIQASALVNGTSIIRDFGVPEQFTYYHVELESHELLLAEGVLAESFVDNVERSHFHNWDDREAPCTPIQEMDLPRAKSARQVPESIRRQIGITSAAVA